MTPHEMKYGKDLLALRGFLLGSKWFKALDAMELGREMHPGFRKDGCTPSFHHQVYMANFARTLLASTLKPEETIATICLHDTLEDTPLTKDDLFERFGSGISVPVDLATKKKDGVIIPYPLYFARIAKDPVTSIVKGIDRVHNIFTMSVANWNLEKQQAYLDEVDTYFLPMLKIARNTFPFQQPVYHNIQCMLQVQCLPIRLNLEKARMLAQVSEQGQGLVMS